MGSGYHQPDGHGASPLHPEAARQHRLLGGTGGTVRITENTIVHNIQKNMSAALADQSVLNLDLKCEHAKVGLVRSNGFMTKTLLAKELAQLSYYG